MSCGRGSETQDAIEAGEAVEAQRLTQAVRPLGHPAGREASAEAPAPAVRGCVPLSRVRPMGEVAGLLGSGVPADRHRVRPCGSAPIAGRQVVRGRSALRSAPSGAREADRLVRPKAWNRSAAHRGRRCSTLEGIRTNPWKSQTARSRGWITWTLPCVPWRSQDS